MDEVGWRIIDRMINGGGLSLVLDFNMFIEERWLFFVKMCMINSSKIRI